MVVKMGHAVITGASSGLGKEFAIECASRGMDLLLVALYGASLQHLANHLQRRFSVEVRVFEADLTNNRQLMELAEKLAAFPNIRMLINNAGTGGTEEITSSTVDSIDRIIQLNIKATALITRLLLPTLTANKPARIINVSSMAAFSPIAYKTVYPASKSFISSFSLGLREELSDKGVNVSVVYPGPILTNYNVSTRIIKQGYKGKMGLLPAREIARITIAASMKGKGVIIPGWLNKVNYWLMRILPTSVKLKMLSRAIKKELDT